MSDKFNFHSPAGKYATFDASLVFTGRLGNSTMRSHNESNPNLSPRSSRTDYRCSRPLYETESEDETETDKTDLIKHEMKQGFMEECLRIYMSALNNFREGHEALLCLKQLIESGTVSQNRGDQPSTSESNPLVIQENDSLPSVEREVENLRLLLDNAFQKGKESEQTGR